MLPFVIPGLFQGYCTREYKYSDQRMLKTSRRTVKLLARHSDWQATEIDEALRDRVQATAAAWSWLLQVLLLALGCGLLACGILFFFAFNWATIPKFGKIALAVVAVVIPVGLALLPLGWSELVRSVLVTTGAFLVGPLFGVFGQIYQTGANTYDLFLAWALFVLVWVAVTDFAPLWLLLLGLLNLTLFFFAEQATNWAPAFTGLLLFALNGLATVLTLAATRFRVGKGAYPFWLTATFALAAIACATFTASSGILAVGTEGWYYLPIVLLTYGLLAWYAIKHRSLFYLIIMVFSLIIIGTVIIIDFKADYGGFLLVTCWVLLTTMSSIYYLNRYRKIWSHEGGTTA